MTPEAHRIAIAEACGWTECQSIPLMGRDPVRCAKLENESGGKWRTQIPDYPNDLNAMHEAEKVLTEEQAEKYFKVLNAMENPDGTNAGDYLLHATARQRAEAFLIVRHNLKPVSV